nr:DUF349 domain-containing protein [Desulfobulbaceae bacterium]
MSLFNFIKPKWQHKDPLVRIAAIDSRDCPDQERLGLLILSETVSSVRLAALAKFNSWHDLDALLNKATDPASVNEIKSRIDSLKVEAVLKAERLGDKEKALQFVDNDNLLLEIVSKDSSKELRLLAAEKIQQEDVLARLLTLKCGKEVALTAVERIHNLELLRSISTNASNRAARNLATKKLNKVSEDKASAQKRYIDERIAELIDRIKVLPMLSDIESAYRQSLEIQGAWQEISVPQNHPTYEEFNSFVKEIKERYETYLTQSDEERLKLAKLPGLHKKLADIDADIITESENISDADAFMNFEKLKSSWQEVADELDEIPKKIVKRFNQSCRQFEEKQALIAQEKSKHDGFLADLTAINAALNADHLVESRKSLAALTELINTWLPQFISKTDLDTLSVKISESIAQIAADEEERKNKRIEDAIAYRNTLIAALKKIVGDANIQEAEKQFAELKNQWLTKDCLTPDMRKQFDGQFNEACADFINFQKESYEKRDWQYWQNKNLKVALIDEMRDLAQENDLHLVFKQMKLLQEKWKETGAVNQKESDRLWKKFQTASESNFTRCKAFFNELDIQAENNAQKKLELIELAKTHQASTEWKKTAEAIKALQQQWKDIGKVPPEIELELYTLFREACDLFFTRRTAHYDQLDAQRQDNLQRKTELCEKIEKLVASPDISKRNKLQELQKQWKTIGRAPKDNEDAIWQRFRAASDSFYTWLDTLKPGNLEKKENLCLAAEALCSDLPDFSDEKKTQELAKQIVDLQSQWKKIGPVPDERQDEVWQRFRGICDVFFSKRDQYNAEIDKQRSANEERKLSILSQLEQAVNEGSKDSVKEIIKLQEDWRQTGPASKGNDFLLDKRFNQTCNDFFKQRREIFNEMDRIRRDNLKQKEALCVRLEILAGISVPELKTTGKNKSSLTLADQLKLAFEQNFIMGGEGKDKSRHKKDELASILEEWSQVGPVPKEHEYSLKKRYNMAQAKLTQAK